MTPAQQAIIEIRHLTGQLQLSWGEHQNINKILQVIEEEITPEDK